MSKVILAVPEIDCAHCARAITKALSPEDGVRDVQVDVPAQQVRLEFDEQQISLDRVKAILAKEDYSVERVTPA